MKVTIAIGTHNRLNYTKRTLSSILKNTLTEYEIIVIDDCSNEETKAYLRLLESERKITLIEKESTTWICHVFNLKRYHACKTGSEYILLLDNDVEVRTGWLKELMRANEILIRNWKGKPIPILKGFNRGEQHYEEVFEYEGLRFARAPVVGGVGWLMKRDVAIRNIEYDLDHKMDIGFKLGVNWIDNRNYRARLKREGFEEPFVLLSYPSLIDHIGEEGVHTTKSMCPRGARVRPIL